MIVRVLNLSNLSEQFYTCSPKEAAIVAYAQSKRDWNTWQYNKRYNHLVLEGKYCFSCGDFTALKSKE